MVAPPPMMGQRRLAVIGSLGNGRAPGTSGSRGGFTLPAAPPTAPAAAPAAEPAAPAAPADPFDNKPPSVPSTPAASLAGVLGTDPPLFSLLPAVVVGV